jgi:hypothetical protein
VTGWRAARPELAVAAIAAAAITAAAWLYGGTAVAVIVASVAGVLALAGLRWLTPEDDAPVGYEEQQAERAQTTFAGFWRRQAGVTAATQSMTGFDFELRHTLEHLLAARLAQRHGVSLYDDPAAARRLLGSDRLWHWLDPARPPSDDKGASAGIPLRTLAAIIDRLERL